MYIKAWFVAKWLEHLPNVCNFLLGFILRKQKQIKKMCFEILSPEQLPTFPNLKSLKGGKLSTVYTHKHTYVPKIIY